MALPAESFLDRGDKANFGGGGVIGSHPALAALAWETNACLRLVITGPELQAARAWLSRRFAATRAAA